MEVILIWFYILKAYFLQNIFIYTENKKINSVYVRIFLKPKYWDLSWAIQMELWIFERSIIQ